MSEFTPLREAVDTLAARTVVPDLSELERRATSRGRRRVVMVAAVTAAVITGSAMALASPDSARRAAEPAVPRLPAPATGPNGWVALDGDDGIHLVRPGEEARLLAVPRPAGTTEVCPVWSPDGTRLLFGRFSGTWESPSGVGELVVVSVGDDGAPGSPTVIALEGLSLLQDPLRSYDPRPCATWAPDGRWVALVGTGEVWLVDTRTRTTRRLPDQWPSDLAWRPGTDELAIAGDVGADPEGRTLSTEVTLYSVSTGESRRLGSVRAAHISWAPDGSALAYTGGEDDPGELWLVGADGADARLLDADMGPVNHGIGPEWSPRGDRIAYQQVTAGGREDHEVALVDVADGTRSVIEPPAVDAGRTWYPRSVSWSPDGTTLLYAAWFERDDEPGDAGSGVIVVPVDAPGRATLLVEGLALGSSENQWAPNQRWGRGPG